MVVNTQRDISAGEEILISYLKKCELERSRHSRYKMLGENCLFNCDCMKCARGDFATKKNICCF